MAGDDEVDYPRFALSGRSFVYLLPCRDEDAVKLGFSRDPLQRLQALHRRYFEFFDLHRGLLLEVESVADARRIERRLIERHAGHRTPAPLVIREAAAGKTEWFRGVSASADALMREIAFNEGWTLHDPLASWLRQRFDERRDVLYDWSSRMLDVIEYQQFNFPGGERRAGTDRALRVLLDACVSVGVDISTCMPGSVLGWYGEGRSL